MKKLIALVAMFVTTGCASMSEPCEDKWVTVYTAKGIMYVKESSACVSVEMKEIYQ